MSRGKGDPALPPEHRRLPIPAHVDAPPRRKRRTVAVVQRTATFDPYQHLVSPIADTYHTRRDGRGYRHLLPPRNACRIGRQYSRARRAVDEPPGEHLASRVQALPTRPRRPPRPDDTAHAYHE